jgi:hypothetical protein
LFDLVFYQRHTGWAVPCQPYGGAVTYQPGDRVEYIAAPVFDLIIDTGEVGIVTKEEDGWVYAEWPRSGIHSVPVAHVRPVPDKG